MYTPCRARWASPLIFVSQDCLVFRVCRKMSGRRNLRRTSFVLRVEHMETQMALDQLCHQTVQGAAARSNQLQNLLAFALTLKGPFDSFHLAPDAPNARERLRLVFRDMRQFVLLPEVIYSPILYVG